MAPATRSRAADDTVDGGFAAQVARFSADLAQVWPEGGKLGLAVSGGPDSLALLLLARAAHEAIEVATVDHGLRPESAAECAGVSELCARWSIPCEVLRIEIAAGNVQAQARAARYAALAGWAGGRGLAAVATAHHADDQAETLLMRLSRGCGAAGLAGVRPRGSTGHGIPWLRPLLGWRKLELENLVAGAGLAAVLDPGNADERFERARMRQFLARAPLLDPAALARSAGHLADADDALDWAADREWNEQVTCEPGPRVRYRPAAPRAVALRVIERAIAQLAPSAPRGGDVARLFERLAAGEPANVAGVLARVRGDEWVFAAEPPRRP